MKKGLLLLFCLCLLSYKGFAQEVISIVEARQLPIGTTVTIKGIITNGDELGVIRYLQDETGGLAVYHPNGVADETDRGDELLITGELSEFNNLLQISEGEDVFEYQVLSSENDLPTPTSLSLAGGFSEDYEGQLITFEDILFEESGTFDGNTNYTISNGVAEGQVRIANSTGLDGLAIPEGLTTVTGILGQYQDTYQLLPRDAVDLNIDVVLTAVELTSIVAARALPLGTTVQVKGIVTTGSEFGGVRYMQDETAGIAIFNGDLADEVTTGDSLLITGQLSEFNDLLQIVADGDFSYEVLNSNNVLPTPLSLSPSMAYNESYESQLVKFDNVFFLSTGDFGSGSGNYDITENGATSYAVRVDGRTDIAGTQIPIDTASITGIMGRFQDNFQLLPRSLADLTFDLYDVPPVVETINIAAAREKELGETVTVKGIVTTGSEFGGVRYMQDETAGIAIFNGDLADEVTTGDSLLITGQLSEFNDLLQIVADGDFSYEVLNSNNVLPTPLSLSPSMAYNENYESQLVKFDNVFFFSTGDFGSGSGNYEITKTGVNGYTVRVDGRTDIAGTQIPIDTASITGIMGRFQDNFQLLPRSLADLTFDLYDTPVENGVIDIAVARTLPLAATVTVKGIVTNGDEFGSVRYIQDETGGIAAFDGSLAENVFLGDSILITGQLTEFNGLLEITDDGDFEFEILNSNNTLPAPQVLSPAFGFSEDYEAQLLKFENLTFIDAGNFSGGSANYIVTDGFLTYQVRINAGTNIAGTPIPSSPVNLTGVMGQFNASYQLLPRSLDDIEFIGNPPIFTTGIAQSNIQSTSFTVSFETQSEGTTAITYGLTPALELGTLTEDALTTTHTITLTDLAPGQIYYVQATSVSATNDESVSAIQPMATESLSSGDIKVYFNVPVDNSVSTGTDAVYLNGSFADTLIAYIDRAKYSIDLCAYTFDNINGILDALNAAHDRGVVTRFVLDDGINPAIINQFPGEVRVRPEEVSGIMHNKFVLIDTDSEDPNDPIVWTGATNFTNGQLHDDPNDVIIVQDQSLARGYKLEFEEMLLGIFGESKKDNTPKDYIIGGRKVEAYFSSGEDVRGKLIETIRTADFDLYFSILSFTRTAIAYAITDEVQEGTFAAGIMDSNDDEFTSVVYDILEEEMGGNIIEDENGYIYHYKYLIVDPNKTDSDPTVWTGSYNWTNSAQFRNDENVLVIHDAEIANIYYQAFAKAFKNLGGELLITGIDEITDNQWFLKAYPNPVQEVLQVNYTTKKPTTLAVNITNVAGQIMYQQTLASTNSTNFTIDVRDMPNGVYFLTVNGKTEKLIINK